MLVSFKIAQFPEQSWHFMILTMYVMKTKTHIQLLCLNIYNNTSFSYKCSETLINVTSVLTVITFLTTCLFDAVRFLSPVVMGNQ